MFNFLKDKFKSAISLFSKKVEEKTEENKAVAEEVQEKHVQEAAPTPKVEEKVEVSAKKPAKELDKPKKDHVEHPKAPKHKEEVVLPKHKKHEEKKVASPPVEKPEAKSVHIQEEKKITPEIQKVDEILDEKVEPVVGEQPVEEKPEQPKTQEKKSMFSHISGFFTKSKDAEKKEEVHPSSVVVPKETSQSTGFISSIKKAITTKTLSQSEFDELFFELEVGLLESNVAISVIEKIGTDLKEAMVGKPIARSHVMNTVQETLKKSIMEILSIEPMSLLDKAHKHKPLIISLIGVNGAGKTTTVAKLIHYFQSHNLSCVVGACDTFRAAAIQQMEEHAKRLNVRVIKHDYGADASAVAFDTIAHAKAKGIDIVLLDTAGRLHSNSNLMDELTKLMRVSSPHVKIFIGESITGNDCVEQAVQFDAAVGIDGIILSKADVDQKGGAALSISYVTKKPILFLGVGQRYEDLQPFSKDELLKTLEL